MNVTATTTGQNPLVVGSMETFVFSGFLNGQPWDLTGGTATLNMVDANGGTHAYSVPITGDKVRYTWTVIAPAGSWRRSWTLVDVNGLTEVTPPYPFTVITSP
jgi:hypothetical protein